MPKEIKTVKCPQCGSPHHTEITPNNFVCSNCNAKYFLDNDDVNINYNYNYTYNYASILNKFTANVTPEKLKLIGLTALFVLIGSILLSFFIGQTKPPNNAVSSPGVTAKPAKSEWTISSYSFVESVEKTPLIMVVGIYADSSSQSAGNAQAGFYEMQTGKEVKREDLNIPIKSNSDYVKIVNFENGDVYCILNRKKLLKLDRQYLKLAEVPPDDYRNIIEMSSGIAQIEEIGDEDGFKVLTNDGKQLFYFPATKSVYDTGKHNDAQGGFKNIPANTPIKTSFAFSSVNLGVYPDEKIQLIKYQHRNPAGYPHYTALFSWGQDYGRSGFITSRDTYKKVLISPYQKKHSRVVSFSDLTPGRLYFGSRVLANNDAVVLIAFRASAAPDAPTSIQALDATSAKILWTTPIENDVNFEKAYISEAGYFVMGNPGMFLDKKGTIISKFKP